VLLVIVARAGWSYWRRPDQRFVGSWEVYSDDHKVSVINIFYKDGSGCSLDSKAGRKAVFSWQANDDVFSTWPDSIPRSFRDTLDNALRRITSPQLIGYKVRSVSDNEIKMWTRNPRNQQSLVTFRRVSDVHPIE
jgi:hypothetical protein